MTLIDHGQAKNLWGLWAFVLPVSKQLGLIPKHAFKYKVYRSGKKNNHSLSNMPQFLPTHFAFLVWIKAEARVYT